MLSRTKLTWGRSYQCIVSTLIYILFSLSSRSLAAISRFFCAFTCSDEISENFDAIWPKNKNKLMKLIKNRRIRRIDIKTRHHFYLFIYLFVCFYFHSFFKIQFPGEKRNPHSRINLRTRPTFPNERMQTILASDPRLGVLVFRGVRISSLAASACSTENNIPFPRLSQSRCTFQILDGYPWLQVNPSIITRSAWNTGKLPNFTFCGGGERKTTTFIFFFWTWTIWNKLYKVWISANLLLSVVS